MEVVHCLVYWRMEDAILNDIILTAGLKLDVIVSNLQIGGFPSVEISFHGCEIKTFE